MVQIDDQVTRFLYWLHPPLAKERDLLLASVQDYSNRIKEAEGLAAKLAIENNRLKSISAAVQRPETPKILKVATSAEVRKMTEQAFAVEEN